MKITYVGGMAQAILGDIADPRYSSWLQGETKDVPDYDIAVVEIDLMTRTQKPGMMNAITAVLNHGVHLVDASTGKNPLWTCSKCGEVTHAEFFKPADESIEYADADGAKLCVPCFLIAQPHHLDYHMRQGHSGLPNEARIKLQAAGLPIAPWGGTRKMRTLPKAPVSDRTAPAPAPAVTAPPAAASVEENANA